MQNKIDNPFVKSNHRLEHLENLLNTSKYLRDCKKCSEIDLHLHSNYSDGFWTPSGLIYNAWKKGIKTLSLTDHDTFEGIEEAFDAVRMCNELTSSQIDFIPGIEISTNYFFQQATTRIKKEIHILGYWPGITKEEFQMMIGSMSYRDRAYLSAFQRNRILRIFEMIKIFNSELVHEISSLKRLAKIKRPVISDETVARGLRQSLAPGRLLTSTGIFQVCDLFRQDRIEEIQDERFSDEYLECLNEAFIDFKSAKDVVNAFFDKREPSAQIGYIGMTESPEWAVQFIRSLGGIAVLAHPVRYLESCDSLIPILIENGLHGIEIYSDHCKSAHKALELAENMKKKYPKLIHTAGSDCHGHSLDSRIDYTPHNKLGLTPELNSILPAREELIPKKRLNYLR